MLSVDRRDFHDASQQEAALRGWYQHYEQLSGGPYKGRVDQLHLGSISIIRERINVAVMQETAPPEGTLLFVTSLSSRAAWKVDSTPFATDIVSVTRGGTSLLAAGEENSDLLMAVIDPACIGVGEEAASPPIQALPIWAEAADTRAWLNSLLNLFGSGQPEGGASSELEALLPDLVADRLGTIHARVRDLGREPGLTSRGTLEIFHRACELAQEAEAGPTTVSQLARRMDIPPDLIREAFTRTVGLSPSAWLRQTRLAGARRDLLRAHETGRSVSDIAMQWGFWHLGRFSAYYAELFGEQPSQTVRSV